MRLSRKQKLKARDIARQAWIECEGDVSRALNVAKDGIRRECDLPAGASIPDREEDIQTVGGIITILTVAYLMLCIIKILFDFWRDASIDEPSVVASDAEGVGWDG